MRYQTLLLNTDRASSRLEQMRTQFNRAGVHYSRVEAVDHRHLSSDLIEQHVDWQRNRQDYFHDLRPAEVARYLSHRRAWQELLDSGVDYAIILEDDVVLSDGFNLLPKRIADINVPWNTIKLAEPYGRSRTKAHAPSGGATVVRYDVVPRGCCGYVVNREAATSLLQRTEQIYRPLDVDMQWWWEFGLNVVGLKPYPVKLSHRLGRDAHVADYIPRVKRERTYVKWRQCAKFWWLNRQRQTILTSSDVDN
ncbi:glycosyltransferase family 25 protein [Idiomarina xiamenensis]|uniref:Glycosyl transferase n=1 Tax=Idiomarina xiamenensis 10-D-4 TaxID=740709 RepID=K2KYX7_9GAMM|nr:glycosyltransferase family 25 protein [Idiomarina xiamenensis]EKE82935.1 glycosyl transferase [Idiomarina xiamenensis 10-D-4]